MEKAYENIKKYRMIEDGDRIVAGLSGGADSVCLLLVLKGYIEREKPENVKLLAVHVEHGIRGQEAQEDAEYARHLCEELGVAFRLFSYDVPALAKAEGLSAEEMGRRVRYDSFRRAARELAADGGRIRIAVAHNQGDQAETILWNLSRGSGLSGLCGMRMARDEMIRPLLNIPRARIEEWLREQGVSWRTDSTNLTLEYTRNRIRHEVLPALSRVNQRASEHIAQAADRLWEIRRYLEGEGERWLSENGTVSGEGISFDRTVFGGLDTVLQDFVLGAALERLCAGRRDLGAEHLESLRRLAGSQSGRELRNLPGGLYAGIWGERYVLRKTVPEMANASGNFPQRALSIPGFLREEGLAVRTELLDAGPESVKNERIPEKKYTKWLDYDTINDTIKLRRRLPGDYLLINPGCRRKKLKQYFIDEKIPRADRDRIWLLADGSHILWVVGYRLSEGCKVRAGTKRILKIQVWEEKEDGR